MPFFKEHLFLRFGRLNQIKALAPYVPLGGKGGKEQVKNYSIYNLDHHINRTLSRYMCKKIAIILKEVRNFINKHYIEIIYSSKLIAFVR